jgi:hypothetical protein
LVCKLADYKRLGCFAAVPGLKIRQRAAADD